ncbi:MAG TPA: hypothetical protein VJ775_06210 [Sphingomicrobium sp.]|nr:hypothetical protein [Sphingomicrobium sp.]
MVVFVCAAVAGWLLLWFLSRNKSVPGTPITATPPPFDPALIERAPPVALSAGSLDAFVRWAAGVPNSKAQEVRDAVAAASNDDAAAEAMTAGLFDLPVKDLGHHLLLLSVMGETRREDLVQPLIRFIEIPSNSLVEDVSDCPGRGCCTSYLDAAAILKARAVEMLAYIRTAKALEAVLHIASGHDSRAVRLAALDAFVYNHEDNPDAIERARAAARREDAKMIGLPRFTRDKDPERFAKEVAAFYDRYPEERPRPPRRPRKSAAKGSPDARSPALSHDHA